MLVLGENYNPDWKASIDGKALENHYVVNGYANGWYIEETGEHDIVVEFFPQTILHLSVAVSALFLLAICYLLFVRGYDI